MSFHGQRAALGKRIRNLAAIACIAIPLFGNTAQAQIVDCTSGQSVQAALDAAQNSPFVFIQIIGRCTENIQINRDNVQISRGSDVPVDPGLNGIVKVIGGQNIALRDIVVLDSGSQASFGVEALQGASVELHNVNIHGHPLGSIHAAHGSVVTVGRSLIEDTEGSGKAIFVRDNSHIYLVETRVRSNYPNPSAMALQLIRGSTALLAQGNRIIARGNTALKVAGNSDLHIRNTNNLIIGKVFIENNSSADLREGTTLRQTLFADLLSSVRFSSNTSLIKVVLRRRSVLYREDTSATISRDVVCQFDSAYFGSRNAVVLNGC